MNFRNKLIISFCIIFVLLSAGIIIYENHDAKMRKIDALKERLDAYSGLLAKHLAQNGWDKEAENIAKLLPGKLRITIIDKDGSLIYDDALNNLNENHANRPEIIEAVKNGIGTDIRNSASNNIQYLYYAKNSNDGMIVRVALPYDHEVHSFLQPDNAFLYFMIVILIIGAGMIIYAANYFGRSVKKLKDLSVELRNNIETDREVTFSNDELGEVGRQLVDNVKRIKKNERKLNREREKLLLHIQTSAEGVCFFYRDRTVAFYNGLFLRYYNIIADKLLTIGQTIDNQEPFEEAFKFLNSNGDKNFHEYSIKSQGKEFSLRINIFADSAFEFILTDITARESMQRLKTEMTGNVAHELRTPVTSIRGFLEILREGNLSPEKTNDYINRAYGQTQRLSELISDMSMLTKMVENRDNIEMSRITLFDVASSVKNDSAESLARNMIQFMIDIPPELKIRGNESLLYSVFRNLTDNVISHVGANKNIEVSLIDIKDEMAYISFADNGPGIKPEQHLNRIFDRFYRVGEGRTRNSGGSGLGLSIVKNAILIHGGEISVKNRKEGGLEFIFSLPVWKTI
jgi:signal transduction histidine kinase